MTPNAFKNAFNKSIALKFDHLPGLATSFYRELGLNKFSDAEAIKDRDQEIKFSPVKNLIIMS